MQDGEREALVNLNRDLRPVGRLPRLLNGGLLLVGAAVGWAGWLASGSWLIVAVVVGVPLLAFGLSLRIRIYATPTALVIRSYYRTYTEPFDRLIGVNDCAYSGAWTRGTWTDNWMNGGLRMLDIERRNGTGLELPATMAGRRTTERIEAAVNAWLDRQDGQDGASI